MTNRRAGWQTFFYVDGYDLSGDSNNIEPSDVYDSSEVSGFQQRKEYIPGQGEGKLSYRGWFNKSAGASHEILSARRGTAVHMAYGWGQNVGDSGGAGSAALMTNYQVTSPIAGAVAVSAEFMPDDDVVDWTQTLFPKGNLTAAQTAKDDGALSANGLRAYVQKFQILGGTPLITVEHSTALAGPVWGTAVSFTAGTVIGAEGLSASGTIDRYIRVNVQNGSALAWVGYHRL